MTAEDITQTIADTRAHINLSNLPTNYGYHSLPLCVIDAVYSIGVRYEGVRNVIRRYCTHAGISDTWPDYQRPSPLEAQQSVSEFIGLISTLGPNGFTHAVFQNRQRTSSKNGILKGEAVYQFAMALQKHNIEYTQDLPVDLTNTSLAASIFRIPGQNSGVSLRYFQMLAGSDDFIKPDRMILRFLENAVRHKLSVADATPLLQEVCRSLRPEYPLLTPRLLDNRIWQYQRARKNTQ